MADYCFIVREDDFKANKINLEEILPRLAWAGQAGNTDRIRMSGSFDE